MGRFNNDGWLDIYITGANSSGPSYLFTNNGNGTFTRITSSVTIQNAGYSWGCTWGDYDNDGALHAWVAPDESYMVFNSHRPGSHTATLLLGGQVLVAGGLGNSGVTNSAELHDPATGRSTPMPAEHRTRPSHGHLVAGGCGKPVLPA